MLLRCIRNKQTFLSYVLSTYVTISASEKRAGSYTYCFKCSIVTSLVNKERFENSSFFNSCNSKRMWFLMQCCGEGFETLKIFFQVKLLYRSVSMIV